MDMRKALQMQYGIAPDDQPQPGMSQWGAMIHALGQDATKIGTGIKKGVTKLGEEMKYPHGTDPKNYTATMGAALNTLGLGYGPAVGRMAMGARPNPAQMNIGVWQGGPNKYGPEGAAKSLDHIGKGEGAQAYGWGRYDAENPDVAKDYQRNLSHKATKQDFLEALPEDADFDEVIGMLGKGVFSSQQEDIIRALDKDDWLGFDYPSQAISAAYSKKSLTSYDMSPELQGAVNNSGHLYKHDLPDADVERYLDWDAPLSEQPKSVRDAVGYGGGNITQTTKDGVKTFSDGTNSVTVKNIEHPSGSMTQIEGHGPLAESARLNRTATTINGQDERVAAKWLRGEGLTGEKLYGSLTRSDGKQAASEALGKAGIPGLKYYDGMSRTTTKPWRSVYEENGKWFGVGDGVNNKTFKNKAEAEAWQSADRDAGKTRNFVTWDQDVLNRMQLLERNGEMADALK